MVMCNFLFQNFLFTTKDENSPLKAIDFGLSDYLKPGQNYSLMFPSLLLSKGMGLDYQDLADERLNDIVGSAYYVGPEVLHRSYGTEADMWSIGVIAYILLCGSRPFWARTESGIFRAVLKTHPSFDEAPWPSLSPEAIDFVKRLLNKDHRKRLTAAQALSKQLKLLMQLILTSPGIEKQPLSEGSCDVTVVLLVFIIFHGVILEEIIGSRKYPYHISSIKADDDYL